MCHFLATLTRKSEQFDYSSVGTADLLRGGDDPHKFVIIQDPISRHFLGRKRDTVGG